MRFLVDESTGMSVVDFLRNQGHDTAAVADCAPQAVDPDILALAVKEDRIIVTNDKDFGELVFRSGQPCPGVVFLRPAAESAANRIRLIQAILATCADQLAGRFVVATDGNIRIRPLPS